MADPDPGPDFRLLPLARGRRPQPQAVPEVPGDTSPIKLTRPMILSH